MAEVQIPEGEENVEILFDEEDNVLDPSLLTQEVEIPFEENLAEFLDPATLSEVSSELTTAFEEDLSSRGDWYEAFKDGLELLGVDSDPRSEPFEGGGS